MDENSLTVELGGAISLIAFAKAMSEFGELILELTQEVTGPDVVIHWEIAQLASGSAIATIRGIPQGESDAGAVNAVVEAYAIIARSMAEQTPIPYSEPIIRRAVALTDLVTGSITAIRLATADYEATIRQPVSYPQIRKQYTVGTLVGVVHTITESRTVGKTGPRLAMTMHDVVSHHRVFCRLNPEQEELARAVWRNRVAVTGHIYRDVVKGWPLEVKDIQRIEIVEAPTPGTFRQARGILPWREGDEPSEAIIRRIRDAS